MKLIVQVLNGDVPGTSLLGCEVFEGVGSAVGRRTAEADIESR
jgi:hypothetical protein